MNIFRPIRALGRAGNAYACQTCGTPLRAKSAGRRARFCCDACRVSAFRAKKWAARYDGLGPLRNSKNNADNSTACNGHFRDRTPDISAPKRVITQEVIRGLDWHEVISADGVACLVAQIARR